MYKLNYSKEVIDHSKEIFVFDRIKKFLQLAYRIMQRKGLDIIGECESSEYLQNFWASERKYQNVLHYLQRISKQDDPLLYRVTFIINKYRTFMLEHNMRLVMAMVKRFGKYSFVPHDEMIQEGTAGLIKAIDKFDHIKGFKFSTYASHWIKQRVYKVMNEYVKVIKIPSYVYRHKSVLDKEHKVIPSKMISLHYAQNEEDWSLQESIADAAISDSVDLVDSTIYSLKLTKWLATRTPEEEAIFRFFYGIGVIDPLNRTQLSVKFSYSLHKIKGILDRLMNSFKQYLGQKLH